MIQVQEGDFVKRYMSGVLMMELKVTKVTDEIIHCGDWTFDRGTGVEIDEDLGWGPSTHTGSYLKVD